MLRIISTSRLAELDNLASAFPTVRSKCDGLEKDLDSAHRRSEQLERELQKAKEKFQQEQAATARTYEERLATAGQSARLNDHLLNQEQERANRIERVADEKVRKLKGEIERLKAKLAANPVPDPEGVVARFQNLVGAPIDLTLYVKDAETDDTYRYARYVELRLVSACSGCDYTQEETREVYDSAEARQRFLTNRYEGGMLKGWAQEHAETCRAVALPALVTA
ncbi:hypothetical protein ACIGW8_31545 [Streptomyces sioyaensis]|uniref:hypothetical protein n=1 Tax=Streptomyces sioyaensis TaxID=67364 RepID=UPI0037D65E4E